MQLTEHFSLEEFTASAKARELGIDNKPTAAHLVRLKNLAANMEKVRALFGGRAIIITSGYRNPELNAAVRGVPSSAHAKGDAADFHVAGLTDLEAAKVIKRSAVEFDQLIYEKGRCVHISFDPRLRGEVKSQPSGPGGPTFWGLEP